MRYRLLGLILLIVFSMTVAKGQEVIYLIRHAEQELYLEDPPLTYAGHQRAKAWASNLRDAGIKVIYTSKKQRTQQTGEHIAQALNIPMESVPRKEVTLLVNKIRTQNADERVLIVTHKLQMPRIFKELGLSAEVAENVTFSRDEYGNLFIFVPKGEGDGTVLQLRY
jgi:broad specificity phosphatase PhoE